MPPNLRLYQLLERHEAELVEAYSKALDDARLPSYEHVSPEDHEWNHKIVLRHLMNAVRTQDTPRPRRVLRRPRRAPLPEGLPGRGPLPRDRRSGRRLHARPRARSRGEGARRARSTTTSRRRSSGASTASRRPTRRSRRPTRGGSAPRLRATPLQPRAADAAGPARSATARR